MSIMQRMTTVQAAMLALTTGVVVIGIGLMAGVGLYFARLFR